jgi:hypothetical protein
LGDFSLASFRAFLVWVLGVRVEAAGLVGGLAINLSRSGSVVFEPQPVKGFKDWWGWVESELRSGDQESELAFNRLFAMVGAA